MTSEDAALDRLQDEGSGLGFPVDRYGPEPDQLIEVCESQVGAGMAVPDPRATPDPRTKPIRRPTPDQVARARTLVLVHGGYFRPAVDRTHARPMARALAASGWRVALAEYRRVPGDPAATTDDLVALDAHLRETGHDVALWAGHSAGGALVMWRALQQRLPPTPVLALAPVADFDAAVAEHLGADAVRDWIGADPQQSPDLYDRLDPSRLAAARSAAVPEPASGPAAQRISIVHGDEDGAVPLRQTQAWPRTVLAGAHHFDVIDPASRHWPAIIAAIDEHGSPSPRAEQPLAPR